MRHLLAGDGSAITLHLANNPNDTATVVQMIREARDKNDQLRLTWLDRMRQDDAIVPEDYEQARAVVLGGASAQVPAAGLNATGGWPDAAPLAPPHQRPIALPSAQPENSASRRTTGPANPFPTTPPLPVPSPGPEARDVDPSMTRTQRPGTPPTPADPPGRPVSSSGPANPFAPPRAAPPLRATDPLPTEPPAPWDVNAIRTDNDSVLVSWSGNGEVEYRVRCLLGGDRWRVVGRTRMTKIVDGVALPGALPVYTVSAAMSGKRSVEVRSDH